MRTVAIILLFWSALTVLPVTAMVFAAWLTTKEPNVRKGLGWTLVASLIGLLFAAGMVLARKELREASLGW